MCHVHSEKQTHVKTSFYIKDGWLKILKPVGLEITIFGKKEKKI